MKLFHRIAITTLGVVLAGSTGALLAKNNSFNKADATTGHYEIYFTSLDGGDVCTTNDASATLDAAKLRNGTTYTFTDSEKVKHTVTFTSYGFDNVVSVDTIDNIYAGRNNSIKAGKGAGDGVLSLTYSGNINLRSVSITAFALDTNVKLTVTDAGESQTLVSGMDNATNYDFDFPANYVGKQLTITAGKGLASSNKPAYIQAIDVEYEEISDPVISAPSNMSVMEGNPANIYVEYANLTNNISVEVNEPTIVSLSDDEIVIDGSGAGNANFGIQAESAGVATVTFTSGSASVDVLVTVITPYTYTLVEDLSYLTEGSIFTLLGQKDTKYYYPSTFNNGGYFETLESTHMGVGNTSFNSIDAVDFELEYAENGAYIKTDGKYLGASAVNNTSKLTLTDSPSDKFPLFDVSPVAESTKHNIYVIKGEDAGTSNKINLNTSNFRITNYSASNDSLVSIYARYLAPELIVPDEVEIGVGDNHYATLNPINFGGETISYNFDSSDSDVATASLSENKALIVGVGTGTCTITIEASSEHHLAQAVIEVTVINSSRVLQSLQLSVSEDHLYQGEEFSYSGTITAVYSDSSNKPLTASDVEFSGYDMSEVGSQTVTVSYTENAVNVEETYTLVVAAWAGPLTVGNYYVLGCNYTESATEHHIAMTGIIHASTKTIGGYAEYDTTLRSECAMKIEKGTTYNSYSFLLGDGTYLSTVNDNVLNKTDTKTEASSWTVEQDGDNYAIANVQYPTRTIRYNSSKGNERFATYAGTQKAVTLISVSYTDVVSDFSVNFMHPEISFDNNADTGACRGEEGYYAKAKAAFNVMPEESRNYFLNNGTYENYRARLAAWAEANGEAFDSNDMLNPVSPSISNLAIFNSNNNYLIIVVTAAIATISLAGVFFIIRKRKHQ